MNKTVSEAETLVRRLLELVPTGSSTQVVVAPPFTALQAVGRMLAPEFRVGLAGQNLHWEGQGAFTGEISAPMLQELGCAFVILGHSERRQHFGEKDSDVNKKIHTALRFHMTPILCVGESLTEREREQTETVVIQQVAQGLEGLAVDQIGQVMLAYEPVWAIGTGRAATVAQASTVHSLIRNYLAQSWGRELASRTRILYGGSVSPGNAKDLLQSDEIDGALVGGACLNPDAFATIIGLAPPHNL